MLGRIVELVGSLREALAEMAPECLDGAEAARLVDALTEGERVCAAGRALAARRVAESNQWRREGHRSAAHWMAVRTGESVGRAAGALETARRLDDLPATKEAFRAGQLSETQAGEIASAAGADPGAEPDLLAAAKTATVAELRERCRRVRAAATDGDTDACERIRRRRYLRHWTDRDGAVRLDALLAPDDGAVVVAALDARTRRIVTQARRDGRREALGAYAADALVDLARGDGAGPGATVSIHVDHAAWIRGHLEAGERCEVPGVGPVPVASARRLAGDAILQAVVTDGADVTGVAHLGRTIPVRLRRALEARDPTCVVPGCGVRVGLEIDHRVPYAAGGPASLDNLARLCRFHHAQKTHHGYRLEGGPGHWRWHPPGHEPPAHAPEVVGNPAGAGAGDPQERLPLPP